MTEPVAAETEILGRVLSGTGGVWRVRRTDGLIVDAALRGRLKRYDDAKGKQARADRDGGRARASVKSRADKRDDRNEENEAPTLKLAVGDEVAIQHDEATATWAISAILPRRSQLARRAPGGGYGQRIVAANVDQVLIVFAAANPEPHPRMIDRFLIIAEANDIAARVVINKSDLVSPESVRIRFADYERAGYPVHVTSTETGRGLEALRSVLEGRTSVLSGPSGVGKSSLMNAMFTGLDLRVGEMLDGEGGYTVWGKLLPADTSARMGGLPLGLAHDVRVLRPVAKGQSLSWADVAMDTTTRAYRLRREMESMHAAPQLKTA